MNTATTAESSTPIYTYAPDLPVDVTLRWRSCQHADISQEKIQATNHHGTLPSPSPVFWVADDDLVVALAARDCDVYAATPCPIRCLDMYPIGQIWMHLDILGEWDVTKTRMKKNSRVAALGKKIVGFME